MLSLLWKWREPKPCTPVLVMEWLGQVSWGSLASKSPLLQAKVVVLPVLW